MANATVDGTHANVQGWLDDSSTGTGDKLTINAGEWTWASGEILRITKAIQIIGHGIDRTNATPSAANGATILNVNPTNSLVFNCTFPDTDALCRISGLVIQTSTGGPGLMFTLLGRAYRHWNAAHSAVVGGLRVDNNRIRAAAGLDPGLFIWGSRDGGGGYPGNYVTGSLDHNFVDYAYTLDGQGNPIASVGGSENSHFGNGGAPTGKAPDGYGQYDWCRDYTFGGQNAVGDDSELDVIYIEDNVFHRFGACVSTTGGGGRIVVRHNTFWGGVLGHGIESGGNMGPASWEIYNNHIMCGNSATSFAGENRRGGSSVSFNNRYTNYGGNNPPPMRSQISRPSNSNSAVIGPATGRNFFDENERGNITKNGVDFNATTCPATPTNGGFRTPQDPRIGTTYASGTADDLTEVTSQSVFKLVGLDGTVHNQNSLGNLWKDFVLVNITKANTGGATESQGDQLPMPLTAAQKACYALITASSNTTPCQVTCQGGANTVRTDAQFHLAAGEQWAIYRVKNYFCNPGAGKIPILIAGPNGGANENNKPQGVGCSYVTPTSQPGAVGQLGKYWSAQPGFGIWQWNNKSRLTWTSGWTGVTIGVGGNDNQVCGGAHQNQIPSYRKNDKRGDFGGNAYPAAPAQTAAYTRIGADWDAPGFTGGASQTLTGEITGTPPENIAYGAAYPNALVTPAVPAPPDITGPVPFSDAYQAGKADETQINATGEPAPQFSIPSAGSGGVPSGGWLTITQGGLLKASTSSVAGHYVFNITATNTTSPFTDAQSFTLDVSSVTNVAPTFTSFTTNGTTFLTTDDVSIDATAADSDGNVTRIEFFDGATSLNADTAAVSPATTPASKSYTGTFTATNHTLKATATDSGGATTDSSSITITVSDPGAGGPKPPTIVVTG